MSEPFIHPTSIVEDGVDLGVSTSIWHHAHVRAGARLGAGCVVGKSSFVDQGVQIGDGVRIQNHVSIFSGVTLADEILVGPSVCFTNDLYPRARSGGGAEWEATPTFVATGVAIGANATIVCGNTIGEWAVVGAGSVVTNDVAPHALVVGNPARVVGWVDRDGRVVSRDPEGPPEGLVDD